MIKFPEYLRKLKEIAKIERPIVRNPKIGCLYTFNYDPKTKSEMAYYDTLPLVIPLNLYKDGFFGINFHFLCIEERNAILKLILPFNMDEKDSKLIRANYMGLRRLSKGIWNHISRRYSYSNLMSKMIKIPIDTWKEIVDLPVISIKKKPNARGIYKHGR